MKNPKDRKARQRLAKNHPSGAFQAPLPSLPFLVTWIFWGWLSCFSLHFFVVLGFLAKFAILNPNMDNVKDI